MSQKRRYADGSFVAHGLDLIGGRWSLYIVSELMSGPQRFSALQRKVSGIPANMLSQRLVEFEKAHIVKRTKSSEVYQYELTQWGCELQPVVRALSQWKSRCDCHGPGRVQNEGLRQ